jgi:TonB family protein
MKRLWIVAVLGASAYGADVQAFIPSMRPVTRVEPDFPEAATREGIAGPVNLFVTVGPDGKVVDAEAAEGPAVLRPAAIEAVRQWTFRPVLRDGHPVTVITTAMVQVTPPRMPMARFNAEETRNYVKRMHELQQRFPRTPAQVLADDEQQSENDFGLHRFYDLPKLAKEAYQAGDLTKAAALATELLDLARQYPDDWNYGNAVHDGNMVLGLVALRSGNAAAAVASLQAAGKTPGSPQLNSFGPNMTLAQALIEAGQGDAVLEYFTECRAFWKMGGKKLDDWSAMVRGGGKPDFGANLLY